jgi:hypothetical protein
MRPTETLSQPQVFPLTASLCRLLRAPAGSRRFPTLSLQSLYRCLGPYPAAFFWCSCPFLPRRQRPHVSGNTFGTLKIPCHAASTGRLFRGCTHSLMFRLPYLLDLQAAPTAVTPSQGSQAVYTTHRPDGHPVWDVASLRVRHEQLTRLDFHQLDCSLVGCSVG